MLASTGWVPFDLARPDLLDCLELYARCEREGGPEYSFPSGDSPGKWMNAQAALERFRVGERLLLTGHSHQAWPDAGFEAQQRAWLDAAELVDEKWDAAAERAEAVRRHW
ncbi:MAG: hypothetical protein AABZ83_08030, partial [candidate division NC10 bacterium]